MAAIMDPYQPEGLKFSQHYPAGVSNSYDEERRIDPDDEVVKSKPRGKVNSYAPLVNDTTHRRECLERQGSSKEEASGSNVSHQYRLSSVGGHQTPGISTGSEYTSSKDGNSSVSSGSASVSANPQSSLPAVLPTSRDSGEAGRGNLNSAGDEELIKIDLSAEGKAIRSRNTSSSLSESENEQEQEELGGSTTALLGDYEGGGSRSSSQISRPTCVPLGLSGDVLCSSGGLVEVLVVGHKKCSVSLDEDCISWQILSRKSAKIEAIYLSDIYAVAQGTSSHTATTPSTPATPHSPLIPVVPHATPTATTYSAVPMQLAKPLTNQTKSKRRSSTSSSTSGSVSSCFFSIYALRSHPGSVGDLVKVSFKCPSPNVAQSWVEQTTHQMQNFGNRPRKLFVVLNPESGGGGSQADKTWRKVQQMFQIASIHMDVLTTQHRFHAREQIQSLDLSHYDGIVSVGGDGLFNEVLNGLLIQTQHQSGVNLRRSRFVPVTPSIRLGIIPTGFNNSICRSVFGCKSPMVAAAQIMLGCSSPVDISSVCHNNSLLLFSAGPMAYGFWSDTALFSRDINWMGSRRFDVATIRTLLSHQHFEAEIQFLPVEDHEELLHKKEKCYNRCQKCSNFDSHLDSSSGASEKGASIMATYNEVERVDRSKWKTINGLFSSIMACPHMCSGVQAPHGISPYGHIGNGCTDLIMLTRCSTLDHAKWLLKHRKKSACLFEHPYVHIRRVKEFRFSEVIPPGSRRRGSVGHEDGDGGQGEGDVNSVNNLVSEPDDDEITNSRAGPRSASGRSSQCLTPTSRWNVDGDELANNEIEVRVHRHLISVFARGIHPLDADPAASGHLKEEEDEPPYDEDLLPAS